MVSRLYDATRGSGDPCWQDSPPRHAKTHLGGDAMHRGQEGGTVDSRNHWDRLYGDETPWLAHYLRRSVPAEAIPDLVQEVWLSFWRARERYQDTGRRRAFLRRLADRRAADWHRVVQAGPTPLPPDGGPPDPEFTGQLLRAQGVAPGSLLWRRIVDDWSLADLAAHFDAPVATIKSRLAHQGRALRRGMDTWYETERGEAGPCWHLRAEVLGAGPCPLCLRERRGWQTILARSRPHAISQANYFTVDSDRRMWLDWTVHFVRRLKDEDPFVLFAHVDLGSLRRIRTGRGRDLMPRVRKRRDGDRDWWTWSLGVEDGPVMAMSQRADPAGAERIGMLKPVRRTVQLHLDVFYGPQADGAIVLELPQTMRVVRADPMPERVSTIHGHPLLTWTAGASLPHYPIVTAHEG